MKSKKNTNTCDPKYYGKGVNNCDNTIKGLDKLELENKNAD